jgi:hypothetical protein
VGPLAEIIVVTADAVAKVLEIGKGSVGGKL